MPIRLATSEDTKQILDIYSNYIDTNITFEYSLPSIEEFEKRIKNIIKVYPYLVYEEDKKILGYAYAHSFMEREAYKWDAELSIYMDYNYKSKGLGKKLCIALINILKYQGFKTLYSRVTSGNVASEKFHDYFEFKKCGILYNTGYKLSKWHDVIIYEKQINEYDETPKDIIKIKDIDRDTLKTIISTI